MRTRLVRVRRRTRAPVWAVAVLAAAIALYLRTSLPALTRAETTGAMFPGERVTREVTIDPLAAYLVSFGGYDSPNQAKIEAARYVSRGAAGYVLEQERLWVIGAGYPQREQAEKVCAQLAEAEGMTCRTILLEAERVNLRMTAGREQIEAFAEGERTLRSAAEGLGQLAFSIDRGDADAEQARRVIGMYAEKATAAYDRLSGLTEGTDGGAFGFLKGLLADMAAQMEEMMEEDRPLILSGRLKYCHVDFTVREIRWMQDPEG